MGKKKKTGKGRLDKYYHLAKEQGFRARSAFKLIQLNRKFNFLSTSRVCIDLCAAPGGWLQVASKCMPISSMIIGVDLMPIRPIPNVITLQQDITTAACRRELKKHMSTWKADVVLNDGAPNVGAAYVRDAYVQNELVLFSLKLATEFLKAGGVFVSKVFRSQDYNSLLWVMQQLFQHVDATRPNASRQTSAEIFVVCRGYLAPKKIDPRLLEAKHIFKQVTGAGESTTAVNIFRQLEKQRRNRSGYDPNNPLLYRELSADTFIRSETPTQLLATYNKIILTGEENDRYYRDADTTGELRLCMDDLRVLGKKEFKQILKWRLLMRERHLSQAEREGENAEEKGTKSGLDSNPSASTDDLEEEDEEELTEEQRVERALLRLEKAKLQKEKRQAKKRRKKMREATRRAAMALSAEDMQDIAEQEGLFRLSSVRDAGLLKKVLAPDAASLADEMAESGTLIEEDALLPEKHSDEEKDYDAVLEKYLDRMYDHYLKNAKSAPKGRAPDAKKRPEDELAELDEDAPEYTDSEDEEKVAMKNHPLVVNSERLAGEIQEDTEADDAAMWWSQSVFSDLLGDTVDSFSMPGVEKGLSGNPSLMALQNPDDSDELDSSSSDDDEDTSSSSDEGEASLAILSKKNNGWTGEVSSSEDEEDEGSMANDGQGKKKKKSKTDETKDDGFIEVPAEPEPDSSEEEGEYDEERAARALALGQKLMDDTGRISRAALVDQTYHRYSFWNDNTLPRWFRDDEYRHTQPQAPVTKEEVMAQKERFRAIDARPIRKIAEAKARRKMKAAEKLQLLKKQAADILQNENGEGKEQLAKLERSYRRQMSRLNRKRKKMLVRKTLHNSKNKRAKAPKGAKLVDPRMKSDKRGEKNAARRAAHKRKRRH